MKYKEIMDFEENIYSQSKNTTERSGFKTMLGGSTPCCCLLL